MQLNEIFKNTNYNDTQFTDTEIEALENRITLKTIKNNQASYHLPYTAKRNKTYSKLNPKIASR